MFYVGTFSPQPPTPSCQRTSPLSHGSALSQASFTIIITGLLTPASRLNGLKPYGRNPPNGPTPVGWGVAEAAWLAAGSNGQDSGNHRAELWPRPFARDKLREPGCQLALPDANSQPALWFRKRSSQTNKGAGAPQGIALPRGEREPEIPSAMSVIANSTVVLRLSSEEAGLSSSSRRLRAVSFSREGEAPAEPVRNLGEMKRLGRSSHSQIRSKCENETALRADLTGLGDRSRFPDRPRKGRSEHTHCCTERASRPSSRNRARKSYQPGSRRAIPVLKEEDQHVVPRP